MAATSPASRRLVTDVRASYAIFVLLHPNGTDKGQGGIFYYLFLQRARSYRIFLSCFLHFSYLFVAFLVFRFYYPTLRIFLFSSYSRARKVVERVQISTGVR